MNNKSGVESSIVQAFLRSHFHLFLVVFSLLPHSQASTSQPSKTYWIASETFISSTFLIPMTVEVDCGLIEPNGGYSL